MIEVHVQFIIIIYNNVFFFTLTIASIDLYLINEMTDGAPNLRWIHYDGSVNNSLLTFIISSITDELQINSELLASSH